ncbi:hypothetical protein [Roseateles sp.]|uniref:hypothetical protein n=1 Tax=Roseateles sp. TaxID=1971397 RepID=UPI003263F2DD
MQLQPKRPPGRADRKAAGYALDIVRLRAQGYTFEVIREALFEVGIELSESTLRREVRRHRKQIARDALDGRPRAQAPHDSAQPAPARQGLATGSQSSSTTSRDIAETFFKANPSNPLFPVKESS